MLGHLIFWQAAFSLPRHRKESPDAKRIPPERRSLGVAGPSQEGSQRLGLQ